MLWKDYLQFYDTQLNEDIAQFTWQRLMNEDKSNMYGFAACIDEQVVGIVYVIEHDSCWTSKPYAYLQDLFTLEHLRKQGIGRALIEYVYQVALQRQCDRVYWLTQEHNHIAQKLYDKVAKKTGFIQYKQSCFE